MIKESFSHLLNGNYSLDSLEMASIQHEVDAETLAIDALQLAIDELQLKLKSHESKRQDYKALLSPLRRGVVPPEILGEIFRYALEPYPVNDVGLVCKSWRAIALTTPSLWQTVEMPTPSDAPVNVKKLQTWTARAGMLPKRVNITGLDARYQCQCHQIDEDICRLASPELIRFLTNGPVLDEVTIQCHSHHCLDRLFGLIKSDENALSRSWDSIRHLALEIEEWAAPTPEPEWWCLNNLPPVSSLLLEFPPDPIFPGDILPALPSLDGLTSLHIVCDWPNRWILRNLRSCRNLEEVVLDSTQSARMDGFFTDVPTPVLLPKLQVLRFLQMENRGEDTRILRYLRMPALRTLELQYQEYQDYQDEDDEDESPDTPDKLELYRDILRMLSGADRVVDLKQLHLEYLPITSKGLLRILAILPSLTFLELAKIDVDRELLAIAREVDKPLLPLLRHLKIHDNRGAFDVDDVCQYLAGRKASVTEVGPDCVERLDMAVSRQWLPRGTRPDESGQAMELRGVGVLVDIGFSD
ncbi:hypothetical protein DFP72DRAFT_927222 [Ephemerocybe angulata]|uniref:F-box domain-containing protein n=1 Tax=Ephemerocybe angulata TaxID=980116 RepID=A0A8H6LWQ2_9AGAR|nr:hypothetical protein DFP72DRAFT_927222 [Tulosesus angulatus]